MDVTSIWIETERPGDWNEADANSDVIVTLVDGTRWVATFVTYANVVSLARKNHHTGECLAGAYLWVSDMVLIDRLNRPRIEAVIEHVLHSGEFMRIFSQLPDETT